MNAAGKNTFQESNLLEAKSTPSSSLLGLGPAPRDVSALDASFMGDNLDTMNAGENPLVLTTAMAHMRDGKVIMLK